MRNSNSASGHAVLASRYCCIMGVIVMAQPPRSHFAGMASHCLPAEQIFLALVEQVMRSLSVGSLTQLGEEVGAINQSAEAGEDPQVALVAVGADQEEDVGQTAAAEGDASFGD